MRNSDSYCQMIFFTSQGQQHRVVKRLCQGSTSDLPKSILFVSSSVSKKENDFKRYLMSNVFKANLSNTSGLTLSNIIIHGHP